MGGAEVLEFGLKNTKSMPRYQLRHYNVNAKHRNTRYRLILFLVVRYIPCVVCVDIRGMWYGNAYVKNSSIRVETMFLIVRLPPKNTHF